MARRDPVCLSHFSVHQKALTGCAFVGSGLDIVTCGGDGSVQLHRIGSTYRIREFRTGKKSTTCIGTSHSGVIFVGTQSGAVWRSDGRGFVAHQSIVNALSLSCDDTMLATASNDKTAKVWDVEKCSLIHTLDSHRGWVTSVSFSADDGSIATSCFDKYVRVWDKRTWEPSHVHGPYKSGITRTTFHPNGNILGVALENGMFMITDIRNRQILQTYNAHKAPISSLRIHPSGKFAMSTSADNQVRFWDLVNGEPLLSLSAHKAPVTDSSWSSDGTTFVTCDRAGTVFLWKTSFDTNPIPSVPSRIEPRIDSVFNAPDMPRGRIPHPILPYSPLPTQDIIDSAVNRIFGELAVLKDLGANFTSQDIL